MNTLISNPHSQFALLVAGGSGLRMGTPVPKQFLPLAGEPVLLRTLRRFAAAAPDAVLLVVLPVSEHTRWRELHSAHPHVPPHHVVAGGATRLASVRAGLVAIAALNPASNAVVAVHDGVRPLVPTSVVQEAFRVAHITGAAVAAVPLKDSVRQVEPSGVSVAADRALFRLVQTPQCFAFQLLQAAYAAVVDDDPVLTDDASVAERLGHPITLILGASENLKITTPDDLILAEVLWQHQARTNLTA
jgi:2-C-methyl-D-erythritol 4-phosphate cytidylyltransferase